MQLIGGFLADRIRLNLLLSSAFISMGVGLSILSKTQSPGMAQAYALAFGLGQGLMSVSAATVWVRYYGREHLGKIRGAQVTAMVIGSSVGPFLMGLIFDGTGSFMPAINLFVYLAVGLVIALLFAHPPIRDTAAST
jgi:predicted MFS family arabinose efflux permease